MTRHRQLVRITLTGVVACVGASCSSGDRETLAPATTLIDTSTSLVSTVVVDTTTTLAPTTTLLPTTTSTTTTLPPTTTTMAPTTTTTPLREVLPLRFDGIGDARFGTGPDDVTGYITAILGSATLDSGWVDVPSRTCPGSEVRFVSWGDLTLLFSDDSNVASGRRHFFAWSFGPPAGSVPVPAGMETLAGIGLGSTVDEIKSAYPSAQLFEGDELVAASVTLDQDLFAFVTDSTGGGIVLTMLGGQPCGE